MLEKECYTKVFSCLMSRPSLNKREETMSFEQILIDIICQILKQISFLATTNDNRIISYLYCVYDPSRYICGLHFSRMQHNSNHELFFDKSMFRIPLWTFGGVFGITAKSREIQVLIWTTFRRFRDPFLLTCRLNQRVCV